MLSGRSRRSSCRNRSKMWGRNSGLIPWPVSTTEISTPCRAGAWTRSVHAAALGRELDGVREQVPDHLLQAVRVARDLDRAVGSTVASRLTRLRVGGDAHRLDRPASTTGPSVDASARRGAASRDDPAHVEEVLDELRLRARAPLDASASAALDPRCSGPLSRCASESAQPSDGVERRAQLVRHVGHELVLGAVGQLGLPAKAASIWRKSAELSRAMAACAERADDRRSSRSLKRPMSEWPKNRPPSTSPERETTGTAR